MTKIQFPNFLGSNKFVGVTLWVNGSLCYMTFNTPMSTWWWNADPKLKSYSLTLYGFVYESTIYWCHMHSGKADSLDQQGWRPRRHLLRFIWFTSCLLQTPDFMTYRFQAYVFHVRMVHVWIRLMKAVSSHK